MRELLKFCKVQMVPTMALLTIFILSGSGCAGPHLEYEAPDSELVGKVIRFKIPIVYLDFSDPRDAEKFGLLVPYYNGEKVVRYIESKYDAENPYDDILTQFPREEVEQEMEFTIVGSYWHREDWFTREFAGDMHKVVLQDEKGVLSSCSISFIHNEASFSTLGDHDEQL